MVNTTGNTGSPLPLDLELLHWVIPVLLHENANELSDVIFVSHCLSRRASRSDPEGERLDLREVSMRRQYQYVPYRKKRKSVDVV